jgi:hypothetical protein
MPEVSEGEKTVKIVRFIYVFFIVSSNIYVQGY